MNGSDELPLIKRYCTYKLCGHTTYTNVACFLKECVELNLVDVKLSKSFMKTHNDFQTSYGFLEVVATSHMTLYFLLFL